MVTRRDASSSVDAAPDPTGRGIAATLDAGEQNCATLILNVRGAFESLEPGDVLEVVAHDPSADLDLRAWSRMTGNRFLESRKHRDFSIYYLEKAGGG